MATEEELQQAWVDTRLAVLQAIDAQVSGEQVTGDNASQALDLAEAYAWLTRPDQAHGKGAYRGRRTSRSRDGPGPAGSRPFSR